MNENENESGSSSSFQMTTRKENDEEEDNNGEEVFEDPTTDRTDPTDAVTLKERLSLVSQVTRVQSQSECRKHSKTGLAILEVVYQMVRVEVSV